MRVSNLRSSRPNRGILCSRGLFSGNWRQRLDIHGHTDTSHMALQTEPRILFEELIVADSYLDRGGGYFRPAAKRAGGR